jgi:nitroreductase
LHSVCILQWSSRIINAGDVMSATTQRSSKHPIDKLFLDRWSSRAFTDEPFSIEQLHTLLEAAHWAPSSSNSQPWRFVYSLRGSSSWQRFVSILAPSNQVWAQHAAALVFLLSKLESRSPNSGQIHPLPMHTFDAGIAAGFFALQATMLGFNTHVMAGIDRDLAILELKIPDGYAVHVAIAVGKRGDSATLPDPYRERDIPSSRMPLSELISEGVFSAQADLT